MRCMHGQAMDVGLYKRFKAKVKATATVEAVGIDWASDNQSINQSRKHVNGSQTAHDQVG